jgi:HlyD family secretion protein
MGAALALPPLDEQQASDPRREIRQGMLVVGAFLFAILLWAGFVPLADGVHARGVIAVSGNRQAVQHRDGGVVTAIHVREGQRVGSGEPLIELAAPELRAAERALTSDYLTLLAQRARLLAERAGRRDLIPPAEFVNLSEADRELATQALRLQRAQMWARGEALSAQKSVLVQRTRQLAEQRSGYVQQRAYAAEQEKLIAEELEGQRKLQAKDLAPLSRVRALERAQADLQRQQAALAAEHASAGQTIGETRMQDLSLSRKTLEDVATELRDTQEKLSELLPKLTAAREQLERSRLRAPASGTVVGLDVFTVGGVIEPGKPVMEIVPEGRSLVIQAQVDPADADEVSEGETAQVHFVSVHDRTLPLLHGTVRTMSADSFSDKRTGRSFFRAEVVVPESEMDRVRKTLGRGNLRPGLPVDIVLSVRGRTALDILFGPLAGTLWRSFREQ